MPEREPDSTPVAYCRARPGLGAGDPARRNSKVVGAERVDTAVFVTRLTARMLVTLRVSMCNPCEGRFQSPDLARSR